MSRQRSELPGEDLVRRGMGRRLVDADGLRARFAKLEPELYRFPAIDPVAFEASVRDALRAHE